MDKLCFPLETLAGFSFVSENDISDLQMTIQNLAMAWKLIAVSIITAILISIIYLIIIRFFIGILIWSILLTYFFGLGFLGIFLYTGQGITSSYFLYLETQIVKR
jgi:uncharacterized membrane protein YagU involved in acid resistance